jgi:hypothetical protein
MSIIRPAAAADLESTQQLYYFIDDIRYKAQLQEESSRSRTAKYRSARAAQENSHHEDLLCKAHC